MCVKNNTTYTWREHAIIEWSWHVNSIVACCHSAKLCAYAAWAFPIATKWCCDHDVEVVLCEAFTKRTCDRCCSCKKEWMLLQPLRWCCVDCVIHHERDVRKEQQIYIYVAQTSNDRVIMACELYCCLQPQCEALRI